MLPIYEQINENYIHLHLHFTLDYINLADTLTQRDIQYRRDILQVHSVDYYEQPHTHS